MCSASLIHTAQYSYCYFFHEPTQSATCGAWRLVMTWNVSAGIIGKNRTPAPASVSSEPVDVLQSDTLEGEEEDSGQSSCYNMKVCCVTITGMVKSLSRRELQASTNESQRHIIGYLAAFGLMWYMSVKDQVFCTIFLHHWMQNRYLVQLSFCHIV